MPRQPLYYYAKHPQILKTAVKTALLVGTVLAFINHGNGIITLNLPSAELVQILTTYLVPFLVATYSAAKHAQCTGELEGGRDYPAEKC